MDTKAVIAAIDVEIAKLQLARQTLIAISTTSTPAKRGGLPAKNATHVPAPVSHKKRTMSAEARARIAAARKKRWTAHKKAAKKTA